MLTRAKERLDRLDWYPRPVRVGRVRILSVPWLFRLPWFRRFHGYAARPLILLSGPLSGAREDLIVHELCHIWQQQHGYLRMSLSYLTRGYQDNQHEIEARRAARET